MRKFRILRITALAYRHLINSLYENNIDLGEKTYNEQLNVIISKKAVFSNGISLGLESLGHEVIEIICDVPPLQFAWARENNYDINGEDDWISKISLAQVVSMKPDVVFCHNIDLWNPNVFKDLKTICSSIKIIVAYVGYPQKSYNYYSNVDLFLGGVPFITEDVLSLGLNAHTMYQSFDKEILKEIDTDNYKNERFLEHDFVFTGSYTWSRLGRYYTLKRLMHDTSLKCWVLENLIDKLFEKPQSFEIFNSGKRILKWFLQYVFQFIKQQKQLQILEIFNNEPRWLIKKKLYSIFSIVLQAKGIHIIEEYEKLKLCLPISDLFPGRVFPPVYGFDMYRLIQGSRITFNVHTKQAREFVGNMRLFEATGMGTCLLTDTGVNMCEIFEEDNEVVTYRSVDEAIEKANYLLNHEDERKKIALAGQKRTLKDHTAFNRAQQLDQLLRESI